MSDCPSPCTTFSSDDQGKLQLLEQIGDLQEAVTDMKEAFTAVLQQLGTVQSEAEDQTLRERVEANHAEEQEQISEILKLILSFKSEFASVKNALHVAQEQQQQLQQMVRVLEDERDVLLDELVKSGVISEHARQRLQHLRLQTRSLGVGRASSGAPSSDSGVALLLERAHAAFSQFPVRHDASEQDSSSLPEHTNVSSLVHDYVAALGNQQLGSSYNEGEQPVAVYDSDSSLTLAATKSLSLSTSLSKQCGLELDQLPSSDSEVESARHSAQVTPDETDRVLNSTDKGSQDGNAASGYPNGNQTIIQIPSGKIGLEWNELQRLQVAQDLVDTEKKYCQTLCTLQEIFAQPLQSSGILSMKDINTLFPEEVHALYKQHCTLLKQLEERIANWKMQPTIGDLLGDFTDSRGTDVLRLYTSYVNDFPEVLKTFHKLCRSSPAFTKFLKNCLDQPACGGLDLGAFLLTPVQRMPRYVLLLKQMLQYTNKSHLDHAPITACLERLRDYLTRLNDSMEHSFQLVTAQIIPQAELRENRSQKSGRRSPGPVFHSNMNFSKEDPLRYSMSISESSGSAGGIDDSQCCRGKAFRQSRPRESQSSYSGNGATAPCSKSVPHVPCRSGSMSSSNQVCTCQHGLCSSSDASCVSLCRSKLKGRSKSEWTMVDSKEVCSCCCTGTMTSRTSSSHRLPSCKEQSPATYRKNRFARQNLQSKRRPHSIECALSDSDLNSSSEEHDDIPSSRQSGSISPEGDRDTLKSSPSKSHFPASKSMHDIQKHVTSLEETEDLACSEPSLCEPSPKIGSPRETKDNHKSLHNVAVQHTTSPSLFHNTSIRPLSSAHSAQNVNKSLAKDHHLTYIAKTFWSESHTDLMSKEEKRKEKGTKKKMSLKASIKNMLSFKKRYVEGSKRQENEIVKPCILHSNVNEVEHNLQAIIRQLNRMPTYIQLIIFCLKETSV